MKGNRIQEVTMEITVGAFIFMVLLGLGIFTIVISKQSFFKDTYDYTVEFKDVAGLRSGDNVFSRGLLVGRVKEMNFQEETGGVKVDISLEEQVAFREGSTFEIIDSSVLGGKRMVINEGPEGRPVMDRDALATLQGEETKAVMQEAMKAVDNVNAVILDVKNQMDDAQVIFRIGEFMDELVIATKSVNQGSGTVARLLHDPTLVQELEAVTANLNDLTAGIKDGKGLVGRLFAEDDPLVADLEGTLSNLNAAVSDIRLVTDKVKNGEGLIGKLLDDDAALYTNVLAMTQNLAAFSEALSDGEGTISRLINDPTLYDKAIAVANNLEEISGSLKSGEGSLGKLMNDPELYNDVKTLVGKASATMDDARSTIDDLRETSPISTFSSVFFGAF